MKKILILTAGFGDGHNTAAYNIGKALQEESDVVVTVIDVYLQKTPLLTKILQSGYRLAINKFPMVWGAIFNFLNHPGSLEKTLFMTRPLQNALQKSIEEIQPDIIISTYPLYAFLIRELRKKGHQASAVPFITVITDSTAINTSWYRGGSDDFIVVDEETAAVLRPNVPEEKIHILGFPVAPRLATLPHLPITITAPWKILYLPSSKAQYTLEVLQALRHIPNLQITVVTGRLTDLHTSLEKSQLFEGTELKLIGWTDQIPELLTSHHLYIGKAGGAIVHEAMAAECPILVSHVVPGQEEGNIELIERHDVGRLAAHYPTTIAASVTEIFSHDAATWKRWKEHLKGLANPSASQEIAQFILKTLS
ncbi:MAG: MGDG synthase family glycosyltransferase [Chthoniobacterales bacterium]